MAGGRLLKASSLTDESEAKLSTAVAVQFETDSRLPGMPQGRSIAPQQRWHAEHGGAVLLA
jgi:hypothetical protein